MNVAKDPAMKGKESTIKNHAEKVFDALNVDIKVRYEKDINVS
jgi:hypothetical protein